MIKDKKTHTLTFRLTDKEYQHLEASAFALGSTPSAMVRQLIQMSINASIKAEESQKQLEAEQELIKGGKARK